VEPFVQAGQPIVAVTTPGGVKVPGKVRVKNAAVDAASRTVEVLVDLAPAAGTTVRPGTIVNVDLGGFGDKDGLYLPTTALRGEGSATTVLVFANGKAEARNIQSTPVNPGVVAVRGGLDASAQVILDPGGLAAGDAVVPLAN
jgi:multidrug efflux pump subunit AcrA (membrane-fusion protein)